MKAALSFLACAFLSLQAHSQIGIGTTSPNSTLDVRGSLSANTRVFSASTTVTSTDHVLLFTGASAATATLPTAVGCTGRMYFFKNTTGSGTIPVLTIATTGSETIDGSTTFLVDDANETIKVVSNGTNWVVLGQSLPGNTGSAWLQNGNAVSTTRSIGTTTNYALPFIVNNTERMRLTTAGYLGIGTNNPSGKFHLVTEGNEFADDYVWDDYAAGNNTITQGFYIRKARGTAAAPQNLVNGDHIAYFRMSGRHNSIMPYQGGSGMDVWYKGDGSNDETDLRLVTSNTERVWIDEDGSVGIGSDDFDLTANAKETLLVDGTARNSYNLIQGFGNRNGYLQFNIQNLNNGNAASSDIVATANNGTEGTVFIDMGINSQGYATGNSHILNGSNTAYLYATGQDFYIGNGTSTRSLIFYTNNGQATGDGVEKMRITSSGTVGIATTAPNTAYKLHVNGNIGALGYLNSSDFRLKKNIQSLRYGLKEVMALNPMMYNWKDENADSTKQFGFIAQDVKKVMPEVVAGDEKKEFLSINYVELVPVLINAVKEQQKQIEELQKKVAELSKK